MALIVEDGTGVVNAESYASVSNADAYHVKFGNTSWAGATTPNKEVALRKATRYLDLRYGLRWKGSRVEADQSLDWPREGVWDNDGFLIEPDDMPSDLVNATCELALPALTEDLMPSIATEDSAGTTAEAVEVGPIKISQSFGGGGRSIRKQYTVAESFLGSITQAGNSAERG